MWHWKWDQTTRGFLQGNSIVTIFAWEAVFFYLFFTWTLRLGFFCWSVVATGFSSTGRDSCAPEKNIWLTKWQRHAASSGMGHHRHSVSPGLRVFSRKGPWFLWTKAVGYTAGPAPLKYLGLGDLTVGEPKGSEQMDVIILPSNKERWHDAVPILNRNFIYEGCSITMKTSAGIGIVGKKHHPWFLDTEGLGLVFPHGNGIRIFFREFWPGNLASSGFHNLSLEPLMAFYTAWSLVKHFVFSVPLDDDNFQEPALNLHCLL